MLNIFNVGNVMKGLEVLLVSAVTIIVGCIIVIGLLVILGAI